MKGILLESLLKTLHKKDLTFILKNKTNQKLKKAKNSEAKEKLFGDSLNNKPNKQI